jgi:hypothetical protein
MQWPPVPNSRDSLITRANVTRRVLFFSKMVFGKCRQVWRVRATWLGQCRQVWLVHATRLGKCRRVWRVRAAWLGDCRRVWRELAKPLDECRLKQDKLFYAQKTYFICIKRSSLHSLNLPIHQIN